MLVNLDILEDSEEACENLMSVVVESRKRFSTICVDYDKKKALLQNKMLDKTLQNIANHNLKPKMAVTVEYDEMITCLDKCMSNVVKNENDLLNLKQKIASLKVISAQVRRDEVARRARDQLTVAAMIDRAKNRKENKPEIS